MKLFQGVTLDLLTLGETKITHFMFVLSDLNLQLLLGNIFGVRKTANKQSKRLNKNNIYGGAFYKIFEKNRFFGCRFK